jgi:hypothetical protein
METWMQSSHAGAMEVGFWQGVLRFCAKQHSDSITADYLLNKSDCLEPFSSSQASRH